MNCSSQTAREQAKAIRSHNAGRWLQSVWLLAILTIALLALLLAFVATPIAHAAENAPDAAQQTSTDSHPCGDSSNRGGPGDDCCDDASAAHGGDDDCADPCDDASAAHGGGGDRDDCVIPCPDGSTEPVAAHGGDDDVRFNCETDDAFARIVAMPEDAGLGDWQIGDVTYTVSTTTLLVEKFGGFAVDRCVEVTWPVSDSTFALMIESKPERKCAEKDKDETTEIFGTLTALPDDPALLGIWSVADITFTVNATTEIKSAIEDFTTGTFVKAHLAIEEGELVAREVKALWTNHDDWGWWKWRKGRAFGPIESLPASGTVGSWVIAGVAYSVTEQTRLDDRDGDLIVGANVKVEFWKTRDGDRIAHKIKATDDTGDGDGQFRFVGVVDAKPEAFVGDWTIGGAPFVADENTIFDESKGLLVVDAYVSVRYVITDNMRLASEIRTVVPPGGGNHHHHGRIERRGSSMSAYVMAADGAAANTWRIGGVEYVVTPATLLDDDVSELVEGQLAFVNAYAEADGTLVATSIEGVAQIEMQYLPFLTSQ